MSRLYPIASGSSGNCTYIANGNDGILIDAGISAKAITDGLALAGVDPLTLRGIFITHEHTDHISGLRVFSKKYGLPIFASEQTAAAITAAGAADESAITVIEDSIPAGSLNITRFATSHDCPGSSGYRIDFGDGRCCAVCTDLGYVSDTVRQALTGCKAVLFESNHDVAMLQKGPYPEVLKRRILGDKGHLSNNACAVELPRLVESGTTHIILGHLSRENNRPDIAHTSAAAALMEKKMAEDIDYILYVAPPKNGKVIVF